MAKKIAIPMLENIIEEPQRTGVQRIYKLSKAVKYPGGKTKWVLVSAVKLKGEEARDETFIFPCNQFGQVLDWGALPGSKAGISDPDEAIQRAGYAIKLQ